MENTENTQNLAEQLQSILSNPSVLTKMQELLGAQKQNPEPSATDLQNPFANPEMMQKMQTLLPLVQTIAQKKQDASPTPNEQLLLSLKPFLSPRRQTALDTLLRLSRLGDLLQTLQ